jgi:riboflavin kinase/FMN adenylyltransferase
MVRDERSVVTVGTFDGVHRAHQEIIHELVTRARMREGRSVVLTFEPHPKEVVASAKGEVRLLTTIGERIVLFERLGVDLLVIIPFTLEFSRQTAREFYQRYVVDAVGVEEVVVGYDHMFGRDRTAGIAELVRMGREFNFSVFAVHQFTAEGEVVSSTQIRRALAAGDLERAERLLGYRYNVRGIVVPGDGRGRTMGYPTANIRPESEKKVIPGRGIYVVGVKALGADWFGMMSIGVNPTVTDANIEVLEVHLLEFSGDLYGKEVEITFLKRLRDEQRFGSVQELVEQLARDREMSMQYIREYVRQS